LVDLSQPQRPEDAAEADEERRAIREALRRLSPAERTILVSREVEGKDNAWLARDLQATPGAISLRLFRARAKLRVEYLLALGRAPTPDCRPVLLALSAGDRRRQHDLDAGGHLLSCDGCAALSQDLIERRRPLPGVWPLLPLTGLGRWLRTELRQAPTRATTVGVTVAGAALVVFLVTRPEDPAAWGGSLSVNGDSIGLSDPDRLGQTAGGWVEGDNLPVESVPANEGFWLAVLTAACGSSLRGWANLPNR
jgi:hypothetical protein